jgi:uncharacterized membrane protein
MDRRHVAWLNQELPALVAAGVLSPEAAARLREHYGPASQTPGRAWALAAFGILGAALIGAGIILLLAHNWDMLSREARTVVAFAPLVITQALAGWVLWTGRQGAAWREGVGTVWALAVGATIALIGQTYHLEGSTAGFLLGWLLLGLPIVYLLEAATPAALYLAGAAGWALAARGDGANPQGYWLLLALLVPYLWRLAIADRYQVRAAVLGWVLGLSLPLAAAGIYAVDLRVLALLPLGAILAVFVLAGWRWFGQAPGPGQRPFQVIGVVGVVLLATLHSYRFLWENNGRLRPLAEEAGQWLQEPLVSLTLLAWLVAALLLWALALRDRAWLPALFGSLPVVLLVAQGVNAPDPAPRLGLPLGALVVNVYLLGLGLGTLAMGLRVQRLAVVNGGMGILALLIVARFFDSDLNFLARGIAFVLLGIAFLVINVALITRGGGRHATDPSDHGPVPAGGAGAGGGPGE